MKEEHLLLVQGCSSMFNLYKVIPRRTPTCAALPLKWRKSRASCSFFHSGRDTLARPCVRAPVTVDPTLPRRKSFFLIGSQELALTFVGEVSEMALAPRLPIRPAGWQWPEFWNCSWESYFTVLGYFRFQNKLWGVCLSLTVRGKTWYNCDITC